MLCLTVDHCCLWPTFHCKSLLFDNSTVHKSIISDAGSAFSRTTSAEVCKLEEWQCSAGKHFLVDFLAACPYDLLVKTAGGSVRYQAWVRIPKLLRLHRVVVWYQKKVCRLYTS